MKLISTQQVRKGAAPRQLLLEKTVTRYLRQQSTLSFAEIEESKSPISKMESLSAFPPAKFPKKNIFLGLINAPEMMLGHNVMICSQPLSDELGDFIARNSRTKETSGSWMKNILSNFQKVIVLDQSDFPSSASFMPWVPVVLASRIPVVLEKKSKGNAKVRVLLIQHGKAPRVGISKKLHEELGPLCEVIELSEKEPFGPALEEMLNADIHIHLGYSAFEKPNIFSPFDSMINDAYTVILADHPDSEAQIENRLRQEANIRTYVQIVTTETETVNASQEMLRRLLIIQQSKLSLNPELMKFAPLNEKYITERYTSFMERI